MPTAFVFLGAEIENEEYDQPLPFTSPFGRERHDRLLMHFGVESALLVQIDEAVGVIPAGATLEDALRYLWELLVEIESIIRHTFTLDAYSDEHVFWRDTFTRIVAVGLGTTTGTPSDFGNTEWQRFDVDGAMEAEVDGEMAVFTGTESSNQTDFIGYPTIAAGEIYFEFYMPREAASQEFRLQPWRDDVTDTAISVRLRFIAGSWFLDLRLGDTLSEGRTNPSDVWWAARVLIDEPGNTVAIKLWARDSAEPEDWDAEDTLPAAAISPRWVAVGGSSKMSRSDDAATWTADTISGNMADVTYGLAFGVPTWMAVGSNIGVFYSRDADTWTQVTTANNPSGLLPNMFSCVTNGTGTWLGIKINETTPWRAIGDPATSFWNRQTTGLTFAQLTLSYANGLFFACSGAGASLATSSDGGTWAVQTTDLSTSEDWLYNVVYGNGIWAAVGGGGAGADETVILTSDDGSTWVSNWITPDLQGYIFNRIGFGAGMFVVVGTDFADGYIATSPDGLNWTVNSQVFPDALNDVEYVDGTWVAVGNNGKIYTATDPTGTWTSQTSGFGTTQITAINGHSLSVSGMPVMRVLNSSDTEFVPILFDNIKIVSKADSDPVRIYHCFRLDAYIDAGGFTVTDDFTLNAIVKAKITATFTLDAIVKVGFSTSFVLDAIVKTTLSSSFTIDALVPGGTEQLFTIDAIVSASRAGSFTLDAYVPLPEESGLYGDHMLGRHTLGGAPNTTVFATFTLDAWCQGSVTQTFPLKAWIAPFTEETATYGDYTIGTHVLGGGDG